MDGGILKMSMAKIESIEESKEEEEEADAIQEKPHALSE